MMNNTKDIVLSVLPLLLYYTFSLFDANYNAWQQRLCLAKHAKNRRKKKRIKWSTVGERISDKQFRRMFRMTRKCFAELCTNIATSVGETEFKSESYIDAFLANKDNMFMAHEKTSGGYISGETKLGLTLRLLAGGDALDLGVMFDIHPRTCNQIMVDVLMKWIIKPKIGGISMYDYLDDQEAMQKVSDGFSKRSNGVFKGGIGALDGWLVRIIRPGWRRDGYRNITAFFSRKGFYALNVQVIVDDKKRVLWLSYSHKGGSHDSSCFRSTRLYDHLRKIAAQLLEKGFFIIGDSAYCIESFLIPPFDNACPRTPDDDFNFFHSSARITVECAFGEIDMRWGIFWKRLNCSLENAAIIIEGAMRLHNYLVDYRENNLGEKELQDDMVLFQQDLLNSNTIPVQTGNDLGRPRGNITSEDRLNRVDGTRLRANLSQKNQDFDMHRPRKNEWYSDSSTYTKRIPEGE